MIGEPVAGSGIADKRLCAEYKKATTAAVSSSVSTRLNSLSCDCSDLGCNIGSKVSQAPATAATSEQSKGVFDVFEVEALKANEAHLGL